MIIASETDCYFSKIIEPNPFNASGGDIIILENGSTWEEVRSRFLDLNKSKPRIKICPSENNLYIDGYVLPVFPLKNAIRPVSKSLLRLVEMAAKQ